MIKFSFDQSAGSSHGFKQCLFCLCIKPGLRVCNIFTIASHSLDQLKYSTSTTDFGKLFLFSLSHGTTHDCNTMNWSCDVSTGFQLKSGKTQVRSNAWIIMQIYDFKPKVWLYLNFTWFTLCNLKQPNQLYSISHVQRLARTDKLHCSC